MGTERDTGAGGTGLTASAGIAGWGVKLAIGHRNPVLAAALILTPYGLVYFGASLLLGIAEARAALRR